MGALDTIATPKMTFAEQGSDIDTPGSGNWVLFFKSGGLYARDDAGTVIGPFTAGVGDVSTDAIWDAKGDLAGGTGANTAGRLAVGNDDDILSAASGATTGLIWRVASKAHGVIARWSSGALSGTGSYVSVPLNNEDDDTDGYHDNSTNNSRLTVPAGLAGVYRITGNYYASASSGFYVQLFKSNAGMGYYAVAGGTDKIGEVSAYARLAEGDYIEMRVNQSGSTSISSAKLAMYLVGR
jgi:hypothetical protein